MQQVAGALGVALIGVIFYGALSAHPTLADYLRGFRWSLVYTFVLALAVAALVQLLPTPDTDEHQHQNGSGNR